MVNDLFVGPIHYDIQKSVNGRSSSNRYFEEDHKNHQLLGDAIFRQSRKITNMGVERDIYIYIQQLDNPRTRIGDVHPA